MMLLSPIHRRRNRCLAKLAAASPVGLTLVLVASCQQLDVAAVEAVKVEVDPAAAVLEIGSTVQFKATVLDDQGRELIRTITWSSSAPGVVEIGPTGRATGRSTGGAEVTARVEGRTATANATVRARQPVAAVLVQLVEDALFETGVTRAAVRVLASDGTELADRVVSWSTDGPYASVVPASAGASADVAALRCKRYDATDPNDPDAAEECVVGIVATVDGVSGQATLRILKPVALLTVLPSGTTSLSLSAKASQFYSVLLRTVDGAPVTKRGGAVQWTLTPSNVVSLSATTGMQVTATAIATGSVSIDAAITEVGRKTVGTAVVVVGS